MARVTVEKCLKSGVDGKFDLALLASQRARELDNGAEPTVHRNVKNTLLALVEIEEQTVSIDQLRESFIKNYQKFQKMSQNSDSNEDDDESQDDDMKSKPVFTEDDFLKASNGEKLDSEDDVFAPDDVDDSDDENEDDDSDSDLENQEEDDELDEDFEDIDEDVDDEDMSDFDDSDDDFDSEKDK